MAGITIEIENDHLLDQKQPTVLMFTHGSNLDALSLKIAVPINLVEVSKASLLKIPFFGTILKARGAIGVNRKDRESAVKSLKEAAQFIHKNKLSVQVSPEGTRRRKRSTGKGDQLLPFKKGPFYLAKDSGNSITPLVFAGAQRLSIKGGIVFNRGIHSISYH